ncbi:MAG: acyl carrier protein [Sandaracinaceae bacterium]|nr:MAG: acyl carrier protein [Sandaracinaceae bacterium]
MERETVLSALTSNLRLVVPNSAEATVIEQSSLLADYGADSIQVVEIVSRTMRSLRVRVPRTDMSRAKDVATLVDLFVEHAK